jgi:hypothetical protein
MTDRLAEIRSRCDAIIPGPWAFFGNTASDVVHLATQDRGRLYIMDTRTYTTESVYHHEYVESYTLQQARESVRHFCGAHEEELPFLEYMARERAAAITRRDHVSKWLACAFDDLENHEFDVYSRVGDCRCAEIRDFLVDRWHEDDQDDQHLYDRDGRYHWLSRSVQVHADLRFADKTRTTPEMHPAAVARRKLHGGRNGMRSYRKLARYETLGKLSREGFFHEYRTREEFEAEESDRTVQEALYREDFCGLDNPEATFIEHSADDIPWLLAKVDELSEQLVASHAALTLREEMLGKTRRRYGQTIRDLDREVEQRQERLNELARGELEVGPETDEWRQP